MIINCLHRNFNRIVNGIKLLEPSHPLLFNPKILKLQGTETMSSYQGTDLCGEACFMSKHILNQNGISSKVKNIESYKHNLWFNDKYLKDHCVLVKDDLIIDPTFRQLLIDQRSSIDCDYLEYVFKNIPAIFIGSIDNYRNMIRLSLKLNKKIFGSEFVSVKGLIDFCEFEKDIDNKFTMEYFKLNHNHHPNYSKILKLL